MRQETAWLRCIPTLFPASGWSAIKVAVE